MLNLSLQRRKRYRNRTIPGGYKTLAMGSLDMAQVREACLSLWGGGRYQGLQDVSYGGLGTGNTFLRWEGSRGCRLGQELKNPH